MRTRSSSNLVGETSTNLKRRNHKRSKQIVKPFSLEETPVDTMADQHTMEQLLQEPTEGYEDAIVIPAILAENFELKHGILNLDLLRACPHHGFTELHQLNTFYNALNSTDRDSLNAAAGGNLLTKTPHDASTIIENKSKVRNAWNKPVVSRVSMNAPSSSTPHSPEIAALVDAVKAMLHQKSSPPASVKAVEEICVTCGGPHPYHQCLATDGNVFSEFQDNIQGYVSAVKEIPVTILKVLLTKFDHRVSTEWQNNQNQYNQGYNQNRGTNQVNQSYQAPIQQPQVAPSNELSNYKRIIDTNMKAMQNQINNVINELRNEMQTSIQASMSNQTNELKNMMASFFQMNTASSSGLGTLPSNTNANPKGELKAITTRSGIVLDGPSISMPPLFINLEEDKRVEETLTDPELAEYTIKVPPPLVQKPQAPSQKSYEMPKRNPLHPNIPYPSRMYKEKHQDKDEIQIHKFWKMFKQLHINITLADALILIPKIARDVFVQVGRFTFPADFIIVDYKSDPRVPLILGRPFLRTARALNDVYGEELILRDGYERLILNMKHDTSSYSNKHQRESINMIDIYNISYEDYLEDLFANKKMSGNLTFSSEPDILTSDLTSSEVKDDIFDPVGDIVLIEKLLNLDSTKDLPPSPNVNPLSGSTTSSSPSLTTS
ncbi:reverse transcriptase domain-containing protein, partial [Tanacetum coccineum]